MPMGRPSDLPTRKIGDHYRRAVNSPDSPAACGRRTRPLRAGTGSSIRSRAPSHRQNRCQHHVQSAPNSAGRRARLQRIIHPASTPAAPRSMHISRSILASLSAALLALGASCSHRGQSSEPAHVFLPPPVSFRAESGFYASGFYPYASAAALPPRVSRQQADCHARDIGYRIGQDDYFRGASKTITPHSDMFDRHTKDSFKEGYYAGYDIARKFSSFMVSTQSP